MTLKSRILALGLVAMLLTSPVSAGEVDRYLPADTEVYSVFNVRQVLESALIKRIGVDNIRAAITQNSEVTDILKDLGLDPLKDVDKIISTGPASGEDDKGLVIVHGRFDLEKFRARAKKEIKDNKEVVKPVRIGGQDCYEVVIQDGKLSVFVGLISEKIILVAMSKDYLGDALKVKATDKAALKNKAFQEMLEKMDDKQSMAMAMNADVLTKGKVGGVLGDFKDKVAKITTISGGIKLTDGVKIELSGGTKNAADARELKDQLNTYVNFGKAGLAYAAMNEPRLQPLVDFVNSIKTDVTGKAVTLKAEITGDDLNKLLPKDQ